MASEFEKWMSLGKTIGLDGVELRQFVTQQQSDERARRAEEREAEKERRDGEERLKKMEMERDKELELQRIAAEEKKRIAEIEAEERKRVAELEERKRAAELEERKRATELEEKKLAAEEKKRIAEIEAEERKRAAELEERKRATELEEKKLAAEADERRVQLQLELRKVETNREIELRRIEIRSEATSRSSSDMNMSDNHHMNRNKVIKLPMFEEDKDDLDAYLGRFERTCQMYGVHHGDWSTQLARLLKGTALEVYQRIPEDSLSDYDALKYALLKRFQMTEGGYRKRFKSSQMMPGETPDQYLARLRKLLTKWRELAGFEPTFEGLETLLLKDQFFVTCSKELRTFLKEKGRMDLKEIAQCAENYLDAHADDVNSRPQQKGKLPYTKASTVSDVKDDSAVKSNGEKKINGGGCYICGSNQHRMKDCTKSRQADSKQSVQCFNCKAYGHKSYQCDKKKPGFHKAGAMQLGANGDIESEDEEICEEMNNRRSDDHRDNASNFHACNRSDHGDVTLSCGCKLPVLASACGKIRSNNTPTRMGKINDQVVECLRDSGCSTLVCKIDYVRHDQFTGKKEACVLIDGVIKYYPTAIVELDTPFFTGHAKALCMENPLYDVIIGNIDGARMPTAADFETKVSMEISTIDNLSKHNSTNKKTSHVGITSTMSRSNLDHNLEAEEDKENTSASKIDKAIVDISSGCAVQTRAMSQAECRAPRPLKVSDIAVQNVTVESLRKMQEEDETLKKHWQLANGDEQGDGKVKFVVKKGLLYRKYRPGNDDNDRCQLMVPQNLRQKVIEIAHDGLLAGHLSNKKTLDRVISNFSWPGVCDQVKRYCWSCDRCQRNVSKGQVVKAPLGKLPLIAVPFDSVCVDIIGPISPSSARGSRYILTLIDIGSRYPDAVALKNIHTTTVADALLEMYSRVGIPRRVHSDRGSQFTAEMMSEVNRLLSIKSTTTSPYHAMGNGLVENFNKTLKNALKKMATERVSDWDRYIAPLLFALRDVPQASTGYSPFELLYGRTVRGPMSILKDLWTENVEEPEVKTTYQYVIDLREKIEATCKLAQEELSKVQGRNQKYYNRKTRPKDLKVGDLALLLLPTDHNKLLLHWRGPFKVVGKVGDVDYRIEMLTGKVKTFHANMLKKYYIRESATETPGETEQSVVNEASAVACVIHDDEGIEGQEISDTHETAMLPLYNVVQKETVDHVMICPDLNEHQKRQAMNLVREYADIFSDVPKVTNLIEHRIQLTQREPVRCKMYPLPYKLQETIDKEIKDMTALNIIEGSEAAYCSPLVIVKKADMTNRVCVNFKNLNSITVFDPEPMMSADDIFPKLAGSQFYSKFDFSKGYWQIPMAEDSKDYTSFATSSGLRRFRVMPFGLVNAGSTYNRMMRKMLQGSHNLESYLDDVLSYTKTWEEHLKILRDFFGRVRRANLSLRPSKCQIGFTKVEFLGHTLTGDTIEPRSAALEKILETSRPTTKKQVRALLGMVNFYRKFIPDCSTLTTPLSDLTAKRCSNTVSWGDDQELAFVRLKQLLSRSPILKLPDLSRPFILQTDACDLGLGGVLLQEYDGIKHPVAYASRKLLDRERNYTVGERECLAVVWAVQKFSRFLTDNQFILETDHRPLECLNSGNTTNPRIMRWGLALQSFFFSVRYIKGTENVLADCLSRC